MLLGLDPLHQLGRRQYAFGAHFYLEHIGIERAQQFFLERVQGPVMPIKASTRPAVMPKNQCNWNSVFFTTSITLCCCRRLRGVHYALIRKSPAHWNERGPWLLL